MGAKGLKQKNHDPQLDFSLYETKSFGLKDYLSKGSYTTKLPLSEDGVFTFHWGDWKHSCQFQRDSKVSDSDITEKKFAEIRELFESLKEQEVWVNNQINSKKISLYDLYRSYLDPRIRHLWFSSKQNNFMVSFQSEAGPYVPLNSMRWFNKDIYSCFVFDRILAEKTPNRDFRLGVSSPVACRVDNFPLNYDYTQMHQITKSGILFKVLTVEFYNRLLSGEHVFFEFETDLFARLGECKDSKSWKKTLLKQNTNLSTSDQRQVYSIDIKNVMSGHGNIENFKSAHSKEFYLFVPWEKFEAHSNGPRITEHLHYFLAGAEILLTEELEKLIA